MLRIKNNLFKKFNKFKKNKALLTELGEQITYEKLIYDSKKISHQIENEKKLVFLLCQNNIETITGYVSFVNKGYAVALLDNRINTIFLKKLTDLYKPSYIFCEKTKTSIFKIYEPIYNFRSFKLLKNPTRVKNSIHKDLMLLTSTSGTTGSPKFVKLSYLNVESNTSKIIKYLKISKRDIAITSLPFAYVYGLSVINTHLVSGATIVLTNRSMVEKKFWELIEKNRVNNLAGVPYNYLLIEKIFQKKIPETLKYTTQAGGKMDNNLIKKILRIYKLKKIKFIQMYGSSEATSRMSYLKPEYAMKKLGSIGKPITGGKFYLIDRKGNKIFQKYKKGELVYKGKNVFMGYAKNLIDLSLPDQSSGLLETGDLAYVDNDGFYFLIGRKDRYVKIFGIRINLSEMENILFKKGIFTIMKKSRENKIQIFFKNLSKAKEGVRYLAKVTSISQSVFLIKKITDKNLTENLKYKI